MIRALMIPVGLLIVIGLPLLVCWLIHLREKRNGKLSKENKQLRLTLERIEARAIDAVKLDDVSSQMLFPEDVLIEIRNLRRKELS